MFDRRVQSWLREQVYPHLKVSDREFSTALVLAVVLATADSLAGLPIPGTVAGSWWPGFTRAAVWAGEVFGLFVIITTGWTFVEMAAAATQLIAVLTRPSPNERDVALEPILPREIDPEGLRRLGGIFIEMVAYGLFVFGLLLISRLSGLGMARWRWEAGIIPIGLVLFGLGLLMILAYWAFCFHTFVALIHEVKNDRVRELSEIREALADQIRQHEAIRMALDQEETPPPSSFDWEAENKQYEAEKRVIYDTPSVPGAPPMPSPPGGPSSSPWSPRSSPCSSGAGGAPWPTPSGRPSVIVGGRLIGHHGPSNNHPDAPPRGNRRTCPSRAAPRSSRLPPEGRRGPPDHRRGGRHGPVGQVRRGGRDRPDHHLQLGPISHGRAGQPGGADALRRRQRDRHGDGPRGAAGRRAYARPGGGLRHRPVPRDVPIPARGAGRRVRRRAELPHRRPDRRQLPPGPGRDRAWATTRRSR